MNAHIFLCLLALTAAARGASLLSIDFNCRTNSAATNTQAGFTAFLITSNVSISAFQTNETVRMFGTNRVHIWGNGLNRGYGDRYHVLPTNQGAFTESELLRDCVYLRDSTTNGGLNIQIDNLPATNRFLITLWSFDALSQPTRSSDWYANKVLVRPGYEFDNAVMPVRNDQYRFSFTAITDTNGQLLIEGRRNAKSTVGDTTVPQAAVFLNALQIDPEPLDILSISTNASELRIMFVVRPQPGSYTIEETTGLSWVATSGVSYSTPTNNRVVARFPTPTGSRLYRIRYN